MIEIRPPTPAADFIARGGHCFAEDLKTGSGVEGGGRDVDATVEVDCVVSWFEADMGDGGVLSTGPGQPSSLGGHWVQCIQLLAEPVRLPCMQQGGKLVLEAEYIVDRIMFKLRV